VRRRVDGGSRQRRASAALGGNCGYLQAASKRASAALAGIADAPGAAAWPTHAQYARGAGCNRGRREAAVWLTSLDGAPAVSAEIADARRTAF